jgi:hypothetical protein
MKTELTLAVPTDKLWKQLEYKENAVKGTGGWVPVSQKN